MDVSGVNRVPPAKDAVELFEDLLGETDLDRRADEPDLVAARPRVDPELLLDDAKRPVALAVEGGGGLVVVEDQRLTGGGSGAGQWIP